MSTYNRYKFKDKTTGMTYETLAKDSIDAQEQIADMYGVKYDNLVRI